ncbi:MAG: dihydroneopterin aldolase [Pseudomonadota bacterium]
MNSTIYLKQLELDLSLGTYGPDDIVPEKHLLNLTLMIDPRLAFIEADEMGCVFDYDPLIREIDRLAKDKHYHTQERLMTLIVFACAAYREIEALDVSLSKQPVLRQSGELGVNLSISRDDLRALREKQDR